MAAKSVSTVGGVIALGIALRRSTFFDVRRFVRATLGCAAAVVVAEVVIQGGLRLGLPWLAEIALGLAFYAAVIHVTHVLSLAQFKELLGKLRSFTPDPAAPSPAAQDL